MHWKREASVAHLVERYRMTMNEACDLIYPWGKHAGKPLRDVPQASITWLANRVTHGWNKPEFLKLVRAARIMTLDRILREDEEKSIIRVANRTAAVDAKHVYVKCSDCGKQKRIPRVLMGRAARQRCECGGYMRSDDDRPIDEYVTVKEAMDRYGVTKGLIERGIRRGWVICRKERGTRYLGVASVQSWIQRDKQDRDPLLNH